jgi:hypothetical protein
MLLPSGDQNMLTSRHMLPNIDISTVIKYVLLRFTCINFSKKESNIAWLMKITIVYQIMGMVLPDQPTDRGWIQVLIVLMQQELELSPA